MTERLVFAEAGEAEGLAGFLGRLLRYDRAAAVRLRAAAPVPTVPGAPGGSVLAAFGQAPALDVIVVRTARLDTAADLDTTLSAGELADAIDTGKPAGAGLAVALPGPVTGPSWAGLLPPRSGWRQLAGLPPAAELGGAVAAAVAEFKARVDALPEDKRTRSELDRIGGEIWGRRLGQTPLPLRAAHAARVFGLLREDASVGLLASGRWLRLRTPYGSVALRRAGGQPLGVTPV